MTLFNRPMGIWAIAIYSLYGMVGTALNLFAVASPSTVVVYIGWDYYLFGNLLIILSAGLLVGILALRKFAVNTMVAIIVVSFLGYIMPGIRMFSGGVPLVEVFASLIFIILLATVINLGILWYLVTLRSRGVLK